MRIKVLLLPLAALALLVLLGFGSIFLWTAANGFGLGKSRRISTADCRPRKLARVDLCVGFDDSFQECNFYFRARGVPDRAWCEGLRAISREPGAPLPQCDFAIPARWTTVRCVEYGFDTALRCFGCRKGGNEENMTYVYAYDSACELGVEQVTCNFDPKRVGRAIAELR